MATTTPRLGITELEQAQAQKEPVVNEAVLVLEMFATRCIVKDRDLAAPPGNPAAGDAYLIASSPTGAWSGQAGKLGLYVSGGWLFRSAWEGLSLEIEDEDLTIVYRGGVWVSGGGGSPSLTASESISAGQFVNIHASSGAKIRKANATDDTKPVDGFAPAAIANTASGTVQLPGGVVTGLSGLTPGARYYLDTTGGAITATSPSTEGSGNLVQEVGVALSATTLSFNPKMGFTL